MSKSFRQNMYEYAKYLINEWNKLIQGAPEFQLQEIIAESTYVFEKIKEGLYLAPAANYDVDAEFQKLEDSLLKAKKTYLSKNGIFFKKQPKQNGNQPIYMYHRDIDKLEVLNPDGSSKLISITFEELERDYISLEEFVTKAYNNSKILERTHVTIEDCIKISSLFYNGYCLSYTENLADNIKLATLTTCDEEVMIEELERNKFYKNTPPDEYEEFWLNHRIYRLVHIKDYFTSKSLVQQIHTPKK